MRSIPLRARSFVTAVTGAIALGFALICVGCSSTAVFDDALAEDVEARLDTKGLVRCDHAVRDLWICSYEPDPGSDSYAEVTVRRGEDDCWVARRSRVTSESKPYSRRSFSFGRHEATGPVLRGCI
jgi:hypothetical protein